MTTRRPAPLFGDKPRNEEERTQHSLFEAFNTFLGDMRLPFLRTLAAGDRYGWCIRNFNPTFLIDRASGWISFQGKHRSKERNVILTAHREGHEHGASLVVAYAIHPVTGELYLVVGRQNRVSFYFDEKEMTEEEGNDPSMGWVEELCRGFSRPDVEPNPVMQKYLDATSALHVTGLDRWAPEFLADDARRLIAREMGELFVTPGIQAGDLHRYDRMCENSGNSTVFIHLFAIELKISDPALFEKRFGDKYERLAFRRHAQLADPSERCRSSVSFGKEALSVAALWLFEHSERYRHLF